MKTNSRLIPAFLLVLSLAACGSSENQAYCDAAEEFAELEDPFAALTESDTPDPAAVEEAFSTAASRLRTMADNAPEEVEADTELVASAFESVNEAMARNDYDFVALISDEEAMETLSSFGDGGMDTAGNNIDAYLDSECGISFGL